MNTQPNDREFRLVEQALALDAQARVDYIARECTGDPDLARRVTELVASIERGDASREIFNRVMPALDDIAARFGGSTPFEVDALQSLGKYRIERELGRGGQGVVFLAIDETLGRRVALKVLHPTAALDPNTRQRFLREAGIASRLDHPAICAVYESGRERGIDFIAMRYVEGQSLVRRILDQPAGTLRGLIPGVDSRDPIHSVVYFVEKIARALHLAHEVGILHRDVKSGNILVTPDGEPVILDFGLARETAAGATLTASGDIVGTPIFMSPEQISGPVRALDRRTDIWSLGVVLYHCLALELPFEAPTIHEILRRIRDEEPPPIRTLNPAVPPDLAVIVHTALEKDLARRYRTALALAEDLRRFREHETILARPASPLHRATRYAKRHPFRVVSAVTATTTLLLAIVAGLLRSSNDELAVSLLRHDDLTASRRLLTEERDSLWPVRPDAVSSCDSWLSTRQALLERRNDHQRLLDELLARRTTTGEWRDGFDSVLGTILQEHVPNLARIEALESSVRQRRERSSTLRDRSIGSYAAEWAKCIDEIAASPHYGGLRIEPQLGLVPLGPNPQGYFEFWHVESGPRPATAESSAGSLPESMGMVLVLVPGGRSLLGAKRSDAERLDPHAGQSEFPAWVELAPFFVSKYEITQAQWIAHVGTNPSSWPSGLNQWITSLAHPVESIDWNDASEFLRQLGLELPTDAQWEYSCRAGTDTPWHMASEADSAGTMANFRGEESNPYFAGDPVAGYSDPFVRHAPVGSFAPNAFGLHDMHGNVAEWCRDRYVTSAEKLTPNPGDGLREPPTETGRRPIRGGACTMRPVDGRSSWRSAVTTSTKSYDIGFRAARRLAASPQ